MLHWWPSQSLQDVLGPTRLVVAAPEGQISFKGLLRYCPEDLFPWMLGEPLPWVLGWWSGGWWSDCGSVPLPLWGLSC